MKSWSWRESLTWRRVGVGGRVEVEVGEGKPVAYKYLSQDVRQGKASDDVEKE